MLTNKNRDIRRQACDFLKNEVLEAKSADFAKQRKEMMNTLLLDTLKTALEETDHSEFYFELMSNLIVIISI